MITFTPVPPMEELLPTMNICVKSSTGYMKVLQVSDMEGVADKTHPGDRCMQLSKISTVPSKFNLVSNSLLFQVHPDINFQSKVKTQPGEK